VDIFRWSYPNRIQILKHVKIIIQTITEKWQRMEAKATIYVFACHIMIDRGVRIIKLLNGLFYFFVFLFYTAK